MATAPRNIEDVLFNVKPGTPGQRRTAGPSMTFEQAVSQYQAENGVSADSYAGLFPYLQGLGFKPERPTRAGGVLSDDKIADGDTGNLYDVVFDVGGASQRWGVNNIGWWYDGKPQPTSRTGEGRAPGDGSVMTGGVAVPRGSQIANAYGAAKGAQSRVRQGMRGLGRASTILGGFAAGAPRVQPATVLGGSR